MNERKYRLELVGSPGRARIVNKKTGKPIPDDEPVFIFRAQDCKSIAPLVGYALILNTLEQRADVHTSIEDFRRWQEENPEKVKEPDA